MVSRQSGVNQSPQQSIIHRFYLKVWNLHQLEQKGTLMEEDWHPTKPWNLALGDASGFFLVQSKQESCLKNLPDSILGGHGQCRLAAWEIGRVGF